MERSFFIRRKKFSHLPFTRAVAGVGEAEMIFHLERAVLVARDLDRIPDLFDRVETALAFAIRADDAVGCLIARHINLAGVGAFDAFVHERPDETAGARGMAHHHAPVIVQARARAAVVEAVQKFRGHINLAARQICVQQFGLQLLVILHRLAARSDLRLVVSEIMRRVHAAEDRPRMQHATLLRVEFGEKMVEVRVPAAFITVVPKQNARMIHIARDHFLHELGSNFGIVVIVPAGEFVENVEAEFVAEVEELFVRRIVRHADGVHVGVLQRVDVETMHRLAQATSRVRPE